MKELLFLLWLHYIGDYPLQGSFLAGLKGQYKYLLFCHVFIWTGVVCVGLELLGIFTLWKFLFLIVGHYVIDKWKATHKDKEKYGLTKLLWVDQSLHFIQILIVFFIK